MPDTRLIERWLPIDALGEESIRERRSMTALPPIYYLHVWWARRPLVASRAAILASLLPADADKEKFLHVIGIHGDPVTSRQKIDMARRRGIRFEGPAYSYPRAYSYLPDQSDIDWLKTTLGNSHRKFTVLDPTAGGGSIPFEAARLGIETNANDINPVSALIMRATIEWPLKHGEDVQKEFDQIARQFIETREEQLKPYYPKEPEDDAIPTNFLWARTIKCPYCDGLVPLSPNWRLTKEGKGVLVIPKPGSEPGSKGRICSFKIVNSIHEQSEGTVSHGYGKCPWEDCGLIIDSDEIKRQAQAGQMGEQLFAVVYKQRTVNILKSGRRGKDKWVKGYRTPRDVDDNNSDVIIRLTEKMAEWEAFDIVPTERIPDGTKTAEPKRYGMNTWRDLFSPRQLLCHGVGVEIFRDMLATDLTNGKLNDVRRAAYGYMAITLDTVLNYNNRAGRWDITTGRVRSIFDRHDFAFVWSYAEMAPLIGDFGRDWAIEKTRKCINELVSLARFDTNGKESRLFFHENIRSVSIPPITITCQSGDSLDHIQDAAVDVVVMDPPYYNNVMYAELSDFFYVWLKRTAGHLVPELFRRHLTDKENEAVANPAKFQKKKGAAFLAGRDYQQRMASIFEECRRVLRPGGVMTMMFTHKATGAWDSLTKSLIESGFTITASWPIKTEAEGSLHIKNKAAASSTIFLVCRPRDDNKRTRTSRFWEDIEPLVAKAVRDRVEEFQEAGISGVDLYLASFGPALEQFSRQWPLRRGTPRAWPEERRRRRQQELFEQEWDPYIATPEDALYVARREVKRWRLEQLTHLKTNADLDSTTAFFVLAWDAFRAPVFAYDEALGLARVVGVDLDKDIIGRLSEKKGSDIRLWNSEKRAAKGVLGPIDGSRGMIDAIHHAANMVRRRSIVASKEMLTRAKVDHDPRFFAAFEAVLEVLPVSQTFTGVKLESDATAAASDFEALLNLSRLAYSDRIDEPEQLKLWQRDDV